jgi:hypothetical protein
VLIVAIFLTITGNVVFFSKILDTSLSENLSYIASLFIWINPIRGDNTQYNNIQQQFKTQQIYGFCPIGSHHISNHILIKNRAIIIRKITRLAQLPLRFVQCAYH